MTDGGNTTRATTWRGCAIPCTKSRMNSWFDCKAIAPVLNTPRPTFSGTRALTWLCCTSMLYGAGSFDGSFDESSGLECMRWPRRGWSLSTRAGA